MPKGDYLGEFEVLTLSAIMILNEDAYAVPIHEEIEKLTAGIRVTTLATCYPTLDRLERKGYVKSWYADPTPEPGGRSKRCYAITPRGQSALNDSMRLAFNVLSGLQRTGSLK